MIKFNGRRTMAESSMHNQGDGLKTNDSDSDEMYGGAAAALVEATLAEEDPDPVPKPFKCTACGKGFQTKYKCDRHSIVHSDKRPFKCDVCSESFKRKDKCLRHMLVHSDETPFSCHVCGKGFKRRDKWGQHLKQNHAGVRQPHIPVTKQKRTSKAKKQQR